VKHPNKGSEHCLQDLTTAVDGISEGFYFVAGIMRYHPISVIGGFVHTTKKEGVLKTLPLL